MHGRDHLRMLAHPEVVIRAPDGDVLRIAASEMLRFRKGAATPLQVGKDAIPPFPPHRIQRGLQMLLVIHFPRGP